MVMPVAHTQPLINVQREVNALLAFVGGAGF
jgi:hypothetical protein